MSHPPPAPAAGAGARPLDAVALARVNARLNRSPEPPWLHGEVARRMAERLGVIRLQPQQLVDWNAHLGASREALQRAYPQAQVTVVESDPARRAVARQAAQPAWWSPRRWAGAAPAVLAPDELPAGQAQLLWANMALHGASDPPAVLRQWHRALAVDGFLMFSTLGPGTLEALASIYRARGWPPPFAPFVDMHDLGDMLVEAGFADPVMDQEQLTLTWPDASAMLAELRGLGGNVDARRAAGLRTPRWRQRLLAALEATAGPDGRPTAVFELVYGHAFRPPPRARVAGVTQVPLDDLRQMARAGRPPRRAGRDDGKAG